jgi:hypothetical protein
MGDIVIPDSVLHDGVWYKVTSLGEEVFMLSGLNSLSMPNTIKSIGEGCFMGAVFPSSYELKFPDSLRTIGDVAFTYTENIKQIFIPSLVETIGEDVFGRSSDLNYIGVDTNNQYYTSIDGVLYSKDTTSIISVPTNKSGVFSIPYGVEVIDNFAFDGCTSLERLELKSGTETIGEYCFRGCSSMTLIEIPDSVTYIGKKAFYGCAKGFVLQSSNPKWKAYARKENLKFELIDYPFC